MGEWRLGVGWGVSSAILRSLALRIRTVRVFGGAERWMGAGGAVAAGRVF